MSDEAEYRGVLQRAVDAPDIGAQQGALPQAQGAVGAQLLQQAAAALAGAGSVGLPALAGSLAEKPKSEAECDAASLREAGRMLAQHASELALDAQNQRDRAARLAEQVQLLTHQMAVVMQRNADLVTARDAWRKQASEAIREIARLGGRVIVAADATDPGPALVAQTRRQIGYDEWQLIYAISDDGQTRVERGIEAAASAVSALPAGQQRWDRKEYMIAETAARAAMVDDGSDAHEPTNTPVPHTPIDVVTDLLHKRMVAEPDRQRLGKALDAANAPKSPDEFARAAQDAAVGRAFRATA